MDEYPAKVIAYKENNRFNLAFNLGNLKEINLGKLYSDIKNSNSFFSLKKFYRKEDNLDSIKMAEKEFTKQDVLIYTETPKDVAKGTSLFSLFGKLQNGKITINTSSDYYYYVVTYELRNISLSFNYVDMQKNIKQYWE